MTLKRRQFTKEFKLQVIREVEAGKSVAQAAREHQLHPNTIIKRRQLHQQYAERAFAGNGQTYKDEARIAELEGMVGQLTMENALLKKPCRGSKPTVTRRAPMEARSEQPHCPRKLCRIGRRSPRACLAARNFLSRVRAEDRS